MISIQRPAIILTASLAATVPGTAQAQDLGSLTGLLNMLPGGVGGLISMIPGLNFLAGLGPIMDIVKMIPGLDGLLSSIPGLGQILGLLGMGGTNLGPLNQQIGQIGKWISAAKNIYDTAKNVMRPTNYTDFASSANMILRTAGIDKTFTAAAYQRDPQAVAKEAISDLTQQQRNVMAELRRAMTPQENMAIREKGAALQDLKGRIQRNADSAEAQANTQKLTKESQDRALDALTYSTAAAQALKDNKKAENIMKMVGSATLENLRINALNSAALTAAIANQTKIQASQAETLGQMLEAVQRERLDKANAIASQLQANREAARAQAQRMSQYSQSLTRGINNSVSGKSLRNVDLMGGE